MKKVFITLLSMTMVGTAIAGTNDASNDFKAGGKPIATIFTDFKYSMYDGKQNAAFEISRAYLGYAYDFSKDFSAKVVFDITTSNSSTGTFPSAYSAYVKNAFAEYSKGMVKVDFGMIGTSTFSFSEKTWGKRYLMKSFMDQNGYGSSADLGVGLTLQLDKTLSIDAQVLNGEGYQKVQSDSAVKLALGLTYQPVKNLYVRLYTDFLKKNETQNTLAAMVAYKGKKLTLAGEFNYQKNNKMIKNHDLTGLSFWGSYAITDKAGVFARMDNLTSKKDWNGTKDGQTYIAGVEFNPVKGIMVAPNVQVTHPSADNTKTTTNLMVNCSYNF